MKEEQGEVQTGSENEGLRYFKTLNEAFNHAEVIDKSVWKITFFWRKEAVRLVKEGNRWVFTDIMRYAEASVLNKDPEEVCLKKLYRCEGSVKEEDHDLEPTDTEGHSMECSKCGAKWTLEKGLEKR